MANEKAFPANAIHVIRTAQTINVQLSAMADQKASILMGATFVIFTITISQSHGHTPPLPLLILGAAAFAAAVCAVLAIVPAVGLGRRKAPGVNLLFFGSFASLEQEDYVERLIGVMRDEEDFYRVMARDMYQNGRVLARKKYRMLGYAYRIFLFGMTASLIAFVAEFIV